ncbi:MAG TPA: AmmeMemoRadiSam system protein A [Thermoanaerobaculia bacterium]
MIGTTSDRLARDERLELLSIARRAIEAKLRRETLSFDGVALTPELERRAGVFVTLREGDDLRGCIGVLEPREPLYRAVASAAVSAALSDPRFPPVAVDELPRLSFEISVLGPFEPVASVDEIVVGVHGLIAREGFHAGLLLPQVPGEWGWGREEYLDHLCLKAGLPMGRWRSGKVVLEKFTAEVFSEESENQ